MSSPAVSVEDWPGWDALDEQAFPVESRDRLADADGPADEAGRWPGELWESAAALGASKWTLATEYGGAGCDRAAILRRYGRLAEASLTVAFILTQHDAAVRRLQAAQGAGQATAEGWLNGIGRGRTFATVGISQLTTSRRLGERALRATAHKAGGFLLDGAMPWVTAAEHADVLVSGAFLEDGQQLLVAIPTARTGLSVRRAFPLAALQASCTTEVLCESVRVTPAEVLVGPAENVMATPNLAGTASLETSALALGQARAALVALAREAHEDDDLSEPARALADTWQDLARSLVAAAQESEGAPNATDLRRQANALVLRATQAYLTARKGRGFLRSDPAQRWARQALFFLVWSCPGPVKQAALRDLAGLCPI